MSAENEEPEGARRRMTFRRVQRGSSADAGLLTVFCSRRMEIIDLADCRRCEHSRGLSLDSVGTDIFQRCTWDRVGDAGALNEYGHPVPVSQIMSRPAISSVPEQATLHAVAALFLNQSIGALPVVDARNRPVGIVTKTDVVRAYYEREEGRPLTAAIAGEVAIAIEQGDAPGIRQLMSHVVFSLHAQADVSRAAALMAHEGVHHVVVVDDEGAAIGIVSALDVMAWLARCCGYLLGKS